MIFESWAMLATNIDEIDQLDYPYLGQPKLDGFRAKWDGTNLVSRQRQAWNPDALPHVFAKLRSFSERHPGVILDGELYAHGMPFQEIEKRCAVKRVRPHGDIAAIDFHAFDIISSDDTETRQITLMQLGYSPVVACMRVGSRTELNQYMNIMVEYGYEGLILRAYHTPYLHNTRSERMIKVKQLHFEQVTVIRPFEGEGKWTNMLGGFVVRNDKGIMFSVGGGRISEEQRIAVWQDRLNWDRKRLESLMMGPKRITISYRDTFKSGKPVQPQIVKL